MISFENKDISRASAIFNAGRQISISFGIALSTLLFAYGLKMHGLNLAYSGAVLEKSVFYYAFFMISMVAMLGIIATLGIQPPMDQPDLPPTDPPQSL